MRALLLAFPAGHSLSPAMHNAAFQALGVSARYQALEVPPEDLARAVAALRSEDILGANVTVPHKEAVMPMLDALETTARRIGAVNTIVKHGDKLVGVNTDASGFARALEELRVAPAGERALLLGAGGSARAVAYALLAAGVRELVVVNRDHARAEALARDFADLGPIRALEHAALARVLGRAALVVNCTSVGMAGGPAPDASPLPTGLLPKAAAVSDLVYRPARTPLLQEAERVGCRTQNGLAMLLYQGAAALARWTGRDAPVAVMREAARRALEAS